MCAYLDGFQCAVIFCVVVMSAIIHGTSDTFITFFHLSAPPFIWYDYSMSVWYEKILPFFTVICYTK